MEQTVGCFWFLCLTPAPPAPEQQIFGFGEFAGTLAILIVVFSIVDPRYRFRLQVLPVDIGKILLVLFSFVGLGLLAMELWTTQGWITLYAPITPSMWQAFFALLFLGTFIAIFLCVFISPPVIERRNAERFADALFRVIVKGNDAELSVIADEVRRSSQNLVLLCATPEERSEDEITPEDYVYDVFGLIANPKFCRHIVASAQSTAVKLCLDASKQRRYDLPIGPFCKAVTEEAIINEDSILHHETQEYSSDLIGYIKPWSKTIYGDYLLVQSMGIYSPLNLRTWSLNRQWNVQHWTAYTRVILAILKGYADTEYRDDGRHLIRVIEGMQIINMTPEWKESEGNFYSSETYLRFRLISDFFGKAIEAIESAKVPLIGNRKLLDEYQTDLYQGLAQLMYQTLLSASRIEGPFDVTWRVQHNIAWSTVFGPRRKSVRTLRIVQSRVVRLLYKQIKEMEELGPSFLAVRVVGLVLNILGLRTPSRHYLPCERAIYKFAECWTIENYLQLYNNYPDAAKELLVGRLDFDKKTRRISKTCRGWLEEEGDPEYLELKEPENE